MSEKEKPRCPQCGEEIAPDDVLIPVFDKNNKKLIGCFHLNEKIWKNFQDYMEKTGITLEDIIKQLRSSSIE